MSRRLPPLNQLRAFEAAARHGSFKRAAEELNVTHAAVSHQIKALEAHFGVLLFKRVTRGVEPTEAARELSAALGTALDIMADATAAVTKHNFRKPLKISVAPFFGNRFLLRQLPDFQARYPDVETEIDLDFAFADFDKTDVDCALRYGTGGWPGLEERLIYSDEITPVCAPRLVDGRELPLTVADIAAMPLAATKHPEPDWGAWFQAAGYDQWEKLPFLRFDNRAITLDFALVGNGVALADLTMVSFDLSEGHLVRLHPQAITWARSMFVVRRKTEHPDPRIAIFADWLEGVAAARDTRPRPPSLP